MSKRARQLAGIMSGVVAAVFIMLVVTCIMFVSSMLLLAVFVIGPVLISGLVTGAMNKNADLVMRRISGAMVGIGFIILLLFPAFWLIPNQVFRRMHRTTTLITPDVPAVTQLTSEFLAGTAGFDNMSFPMQVDLACQFTINRVTWKVDYETHGLAGHVATPTECITLGADDCQGQAVTLASLLIHLGFNNTWAVETPFHWYVLTRDPALGPLPQGWERDVEQLQDNGSLVPLNRDGEGNMPEWRWEEVVLIFNDREVLFPVDLFTGIWLGWTATAFFVTDLFPSFQGAGVMYLVLLAFGLAFPVTTWTTFMQPRPERERSCNKDQKGIALSRLGKVGVTGLLLLATFSSWMILQPFTRDLSLITCMCLIGFIIAFTSSTKTWHALRLEK